MKIVGLDYPGMDLGVICPEIPDDGGYAVIQELTLMGGGKVPNALAAAARLGAEAAIIGTVGADRYGEKCREDLAYNGVQTEHLLSRPGTTALCLCLTDEKTRGKRCIESPATYPRLQPEELTPAMLEGADILLLYELDDTAVTLAKMAREKGIRVLVDGDELDSRTQKHLGLIDILICSEYYYAALLGDTPYEQGLQKLRCAGPSIVVVTLGSQGCAGLSEEGYFRLPACSGGTVIDTTGAGDVFHGAFAFYVAQGLSAEECAQYASAVSYIKCSMLGGRTALPNQEAVDHFLTHGELLPMDYEARAAFYRQAAFQ